ncbi:MAG: RNA methyltransferase [Eubacteriales bacterium]|nr:RNA methyltransferase [Eubacteriales bacterium]
MDGRKKKFIKELSEKSRIRKESGLFVVDGPKMCREIPGELLDEIFVTEEYLKSDYAKITMDLLSKNRFEVISQQDMKQISDTMNPQGILCTVKQKQHIKLSELIKTKETPLLLMLETIQDPGNLGTILRAGEAAGVTGIIMNSTTADIYSPKVVRSTMGSVFRVPFCIVSDLKKAAVTLKEEGINVIATDLKDSHDYCSVKYTNPAAILIGNESKGLSAEMLEEANQSVIIPMMGQVESLNAAMAASVILFEASRQRRQRGN